nr:DUF2637 domain-containing protein [Actinorugispora endophytica]
MKRLGAWLVDWVPLLALAGIAAAGSFTHIRDLAERSGQYGWMAWAIAVSIDLTCVMAARERHRDTKTGRQSSRVSWPTVVMVAAILLTLAANLATAQPTPWGWVMAATPAAAFLVAVSMLERRTTHTSPPAPVETEEVPAEPPATTVEPVESEPTPVPELPAPEPAADPLLGYALQVADGYHQTHGHTIPLDALRARLGVAEPVAARLHAQLA